jgi:uncharacterized protein YbaP (TraB family)
MEIIAMNRAPTHRLRLDFAASLVLACGLFACLAAHADGALHTLWKVKGQYNTVYLLGSVHVLKPGDHSLPEEALRAYAAAGALVMEIDLNTDGPENLREADLALETLPPGETLAQVLGPETYSVFAAHAKPLGLEPEFFSRLQPWFAAMTLVQLELNSLGFDAGSGVDEQLAKRAAADHKPIIALETFDQQLGFFAHMPMPQQRQFLLYSLQDADDTPAEVDAMVRAWRTGDTKTLEHLMSGEFAKFPDLFRLLATDRNRDWLPRIDALLKERKDYLVVVGALHLVGGNGLVEMLRARGYEVVQL